jgi:hypothetical protein
MSAEETYLCPNCKKNIPVLNRTIHELRCFPEAHPVHERPQTAIPIDDAHEQPHTALIKEHGEPATPSAPPAPSTSSSATTAPPLPGTRTGWTCPKCTYFNENSSSHVCAVCGKSSLQVIDDHHDDSTHIDLTRNQNTSTTQSSSGNTWQCPTCTLINPTTTNICDGCGIPRGSQSAPKTSQTSTSNTWRCSHCTLENPMTVDACSACGEIRPAAQAQRERLIEENEDGPLFFYEEFGSNQPGGGGTQRRTTNSTVPSSALWGAGVGAGLALLNGRSVTRGAIEGGSMGVLGGMLMDMVTEEANQQQQMTERSRMRPPGVGMHGVSPQVIFHRGMGPAGMEGMGISPFDLLAAQLMAQAHGMQAQPESVSEETLHQLPTRVYRRNQEEGKTGGTSSSSDGTDNSTCSICLSAFNDGDNIRSLPCLHQFHVDCIDRWLHQSTKCPICKHEIH